MQQQIKPEQTDTANDAALGRWLRENMQPSYKVDLFQYPLYESVFPRYYAAIGYDTKPYNPADRMYGFGQSDTLLEALERALADVRPLSARYTKRSVPGMQTTD